MSIEQSRLVFFHLLEDGPHQCLANEPATVGNPVLVAETIQGALLALVEQNSHFMFAGLLFQGVYRLKITNGAQKYRLSLTPVVTRLRPTLLVKAVVPIVSSMDSTACWNWV